MHGKQGKYSKVFFGLLTGYGVAILLSFACDCRSRREGNEERYDELFRAEYSDALTFLDCNLWIADSATRWGVDPDVVRATVFPELLRYSALQDQIEISCLKTLYVQFGEKYANFSIGRFQIKPSFAEKLERLWMHDTVKRSPDVRFDTTTSARARKERINRLETLEGQVRYICLFMRLLPELHPGIDRLDAEARLRFYATAYNYSFTAEYDAIQVEAYRKRFFISMFAYPGMKYYNYSDIVLFYYSNLNNHVP
ncbi:MULTISPECIES: hypothetical protein [Butyricimonas]|jgi:hypothetical protein|uniref:DUF5106 domain-containing protein n=1 Tax=Butyricimonas hominis TaxID=2763032 RepID=A0ABR7CY39_9BACT|nr:MULTISPECIES: hypothetical protein [Butyricimonas]MBC5620596.1 hypothetical protein [Butyricimonas hominis]